MSNEGTRPPRREFLGRLSLIALATSTPSSVARMRELSAAGGPSPWDMSWVERVTAAPYKVTLDANNINDGAALDYAADIMNTFREVYGGPDTQTRAVVVMRQLGVPMALQDALWDKYAIGEDRKINDPMTKAPARRNPFLRRRARRAELRGRFQNRAARRARAHDPGVQSRIDEYRALACGARQGGRGAGASGVSRRTGSWRDRDA